MTRTAVPRSVQVAVLTEAGYRCAVPTCRTILIIDLHHIVEVHKGGGNDAGNLLALCPNCHALYHRQKIDMESIVIWKGMLVSLSNALDTQAIDDLMFLKTLERGDVPLAISGDGVLKFSRLIAVGLAQFKLFQHGTDWAYAVFLTGRGRSLIEAWQAGDRKALAAAVSQSVATNDTGQVRQREVKL